MPLRRLSRMLTALFAAALLTLGLAILIDGFTDRLGKTDIGVVLGNTVYPDGTPSPRLKARLDRAAELYRQGYFTRILVSGATGAEGYDEPTVMQKYLEAQGIDAAAIARDPHGFNTFETARNTAALLRQTGGRSVTVISQYFHITRCRLAMRKFGITEIRTAHARYFGIRDFYSLLREMAALPVYLLKTAPAAAAD